MQVLVRPGEIRAAIHDLLNDPTDERVIAVAYVGADALSFIPSPKNVTVYCWPQPGGTNPNGIDDLLRQGANVHFVERLHAKIYWSRTKGTLIGSPNLTANALGDKGLLEAAVRLPPGAFDMHGFIKKMNVVNDFAAKLRWLRRQHLLFLARNPKLRQTPGPKPAPASFAEWFAAGEKREDWQLGWWEREIDDDPKDAVEALADETGNPDYTTSLHVAKDDGLRKGVFTLNFKVEERDTGGVRVSRFKWWVPEISKLTKQKEFKDWPIIWFSQSKVRSRPPFDFRDRRFRLALERTIKGMGGLAWLQEEAPLQPSSTFLRRLNRHFESLSD